MNKLACTLLVDDDSTANYLSELLFKRLDITQQLLIAHNGREALDILSQLNPALCSSMLILLDINMPAMDGFEFLEAFKNLELEQKESIVIIMLTTSLNHRDIQRAQQANIADIINKPLTRKALQDIMAEHFSNNS